MNLVAVVLGCETSDDRFNSAVNLLDFGFANYELVNPDIDVTKITEVRIKNGKEKRILPAFNETEKILEAGIGCCACFKPGNSIISINQFVCII